MAKKLFSFYIEPEQLSWLKKKSKKEMRTVSDYLRILIQKHINEEKKRGWNK